MADGATNPCRYLQETRCRSNATTDGKEKRAPTKRRHVLFLEFVGEHSYVLVQDMRALEKRDRRSPSCAECS